MHIRVEILEETHVSRDVVYDGLNIWYATKEFQNVSKKLELYI